MKPSRKPKTYQGYELVARVHLVPQLGKKLHKLTGADVRLFLKRLRNTCLCCMHGYDIRRGDKARCCAVDRCCNGSLQTDSWSRSTPHCGTLSKPL